MSKPEPTYEPIEVALALALYGYNVSAIERAEAIYRHFHGECYDLPQLVDFMYRYGSAPTALPFPSAEIYVRHALERYGAEARMRVHLERSSLAFQAESARTSPGETS